MSSAQNTAKQKALEPLARLRSDKRLHYVLIFVTTAVLIFIYYGYIFALNHPSWDYLDWFWNWFYLELRIGLRGLLMLFPILYSTLVLSWKRSSIVVVILLAFIAPYVLFSSFVTYTALASFSFLTLPAIVIISVEMKLVADAKDRLAREETKKQRAEVVRQLFNAQEGERKRISQELHDGVAQNLLFTATLAYSVLEEVAPGDGGIRGKLEGIVSNSMNMVAEIRCICQDLRASIVDDLGLVSAVRWLCDEFQQGTGVEVEFELGAPVGELTQEETLAFFRVVQEALSNISKHADASRVRVAVTPTDGGLAIEVEDDGRGFRMRDASGEFAVHGKLGMLTMEERTRSIGGRLEVQSGEGGGTSIRISVDRAAEREPLAGGAHRRSPEADGPGARSLVD